MEQLFWRWLFFFCLLGLPLLAASDTLELQQAEFSLQAGHETPPDGGDWKTQSLPDLWNENHPGYGGDIWYRTHFRLDDLPREPYAIYLPRLCMNAAAFVNGQFIGNGGRFTEPVARNWNRPLLFPVSPSILKRGDNTLEVRVYSPAFSLGSLSTIYVGPESELLPEFEDKFFWRITLNQSMTLIIAGMGLFMLVLWWRRRGDTMYGFFGLSALVWSFNSTNLFVQHIPVSANIWESLINASFQVFVSLLMISLLRFLELRLRWLEAALWLILVGSPASLLLLPSGALLVVSTFWHLITLLSSIAVFGFLVVSLVRNPRRDAALLIAALCINIIFGVHDWLKHSLMMKSGDPHWLHYGAPIFFLVVGIIMTNRFVQALNQLEQLNVDLENRVRAKHAELEVQFANLNSLEKDKAKIEERERIYRDLHDDMGAKLLGLAISAQRANLPKEADLARSALQDLRDVVSRSNQNSTPLTDLLADWRMEAEQRVRAAGLEMEWRFPDGEYHLPVGPASALHLSRILREALSNVLRHAGASRIEVVTQLSGDHFFFSVIDDGTGFASERIKKHRGMSSMETRASALNATLNWHEAKPHGCRVELSVPLAALTP